MAKGITTVGHLSQLREDEVREGFLPCLITLRMLPSCICSVYIGFFYAFLEETKSTYSKEGSKRVRV